VRPIPPMRKPAPEPSSTSCPVMSCGLCFAIMPNWPKRSSGPSSADCASWSELSPRKRGRPRRRPGPYSPASADSSVTVRPPRKRRPVENVSDRKQLLRFRTVLGDGCTEYYCDGFVIKEQDRLRHVWNEGRWPTYATGEPSAAVEQRDEDRGRPGGPGDARRWSGMGRRRPRAAGRRARHLALAAQPLWFTPRSGSCVSPRTFHGIDRIRLSAEFRSPRYRSRRHARRQPLPPHPHSLLGTGLVPDPTAPCRDVATQRLRHF
jgi:hypothetical protein